MNEDTEDTDPFGPYRCECCGAELASADDNHAEGKKRSWALLCFDNGQTYREGADEDLSFCSLRCVSHYAKQYG
jgi:hypothetical protein